MNTRQLKYALKLSESLNFSQVAEQLEISQPALSKQIINLENELGVKLFERNYSPMKLTAAGEYFLKEAQQLLYKEEQLLRSMEGFKNGEKGRLTIGISPFRSLYMIPRVIHKIKERYPGIQINLREAGSDILRKEVAEGKYDFAIINLPVDESILNINPLEPDVLVIAVPNKMLNLIKCEDKDAEKVKELSLSECKELPYIVVGVGQEMRTLFDKLCAAANFRPDISMEVVGVTTAWAMANAGIGATILPLQFIDKERFEQNITLFKLKSAYSRQPVIVTRRDQYISECAQYAIELFRCM